MNEATRLFALAHANDDVRRLALAGCRDAEVDLTAALQQIQGRQTARRKLPSWAACDAVVYPPHLNLEQCSSEQTARYKLALVQRLLASLGGTRGRGKVNSLVDLTGGFGVDFTLMAQAFDEALYVEHNEALAAIASHNLPLLGIHHARSVCCDSVATLHTLSHATLIFLDPARRDTHGSRTYAIADCTPDVLSLRDELLSKADYVLLKLSPMLDWRKAVSDLGLQHASEVHIVSVSNECKELLLVLQQEAPSLTLFCVNDDQQFTLSVPRTRSFTPSAPRTRSVCCCTTATPPPITLAPHSFPLTHLYEPNASIMKAGCFEELSARFPVAQIAPNSHLFTSSEAVDGFPGRSFRIEAITTMNKSDLRQALQGTERANITTRNFPLTPQQLRQRLKLKDGGDTYIFATTLSDATHVLFLCSPC